MKKWPLYSAILGGPVLLGILVCLCGILLSLGFRKLSIICFFCVLVQLILMSFIGRFIGKSEKTNSK